MGGAVTALLGLLGRGQVDLGPAGAGEYLRGRRVLVTGAGGSIGAVLCRRVAGCGPSRLVLLGRGESTLQWTRLQLDCGQVVLADVRDRNRLDEVFAEHRPQVVFHTAALKHQPMLEQAPGEAVKTNVWGTANLLAAADLAGVDTVVNVSTDKAADPSCVLGLSKRAGERMTAWWGEAGARRWVSVRFGNVIGSRGSVLGVFARQLAAGAPLTITSPDVDRFFMTAQEAAQLVIAAGGLGEAGQVLVMDMGVPVRIVDLARRMADVMGVDPTMVFTGLRPGEKLHETLIGSTEMVVAQPHPTIRHVQVDGLDPRWACDLLVDGDPALIRGRLGLLCARMAGADVR